MLVVNNLFMDEFKFICDKCGLCCKNIKGIDELKDYHDGNGICKYLTNDNLCSIYQNRPGVCNGEYVFETYFSKIFTKEEFIKKSYEICKIFKQCKI